MPKGLLAVIVKGNPKLINNPTANKYYKDIESYLRSKGVDNVEYDSGEAYTIPRLDADLFIGHSRGSSREQYLPEEKRKVFLKFGVPEGVIHPVDLKWCKEVWKKGGDQIPPKEHFILTTDQKQAIDSLLDKLPVKKTMNKYIEKVAELMSDENRQVAKTFAIQTAGNIPAHAIGMAAGAALAGKRLAKPAAMINNGINTLAAKLGKAGKTGKWLSDKIPSSSIGSESLGAMLGMNIAGGAADLAALKHGFHGKVKRNE